MTIGVQTIRALSAGDGSTVTFPIPFNFFGNSANVKVYLLAADGVTISTLAPSTHYNVVGTNVVMVTAPGGSEKLLILSALSLLQSLGLSDNSPFMPSLVMKQIDEMTAMIQQLEERINRCLTFPVTSLQNSPALEEQALSADCLIAVNSGGTKLKQIPKADFTGATGATGPAGPAGPAGASGNSGEVVIPMSSSGTISSPNPVNSTYIPCDASGGAFSPTLPQATLAMVGQIIDIKKVDSSGNAVTILPHAGDQIIALGAVANVALDVQGEAYRFVCRAAGFWDVI